MAEKPITFLYERSTAQDELVFKVHVARQFYAIDTSPTQVVKDGDYWFHQVIIDVKQLGALQKMIAQWMDARVPFALDLNPNRLTVPIVQLELGQRDGVIFTADKPSLTFTYTSNTVTYESHFVLDQSCLNLASEQIDVLLATL